MSDGSSGNGAGARAGVAGSDSDASGGGNAGGAGGNRAGRSGTNADGTSSSQSGAGGDSAAGAAGGRSGAGGNNTGGAKGDSDSGAGDSTTGAAGGNSGAGGNSAGGAGGRNRNQGGPGGGAGGDSMSGTDGKSLDADPQGSRSGVGVGVGEGGVEDEDKRIAAIEVPNSNVKIDEDFKPQTLGGMLPLVLGVNEEGRFDFDQYALRDDVKSILDSLADKLQSAEYDRLDIIGFTDRIGNRDYNQRLSELRAWAVAQYLIHKGIPDNKVYYEGRGHKDPLTQQGECSGLAREELINCLQKDRRVEIEASIRRKHATITQ